MPPTQRASASGTRSCGPRSRELFRRKLADEGAVLAPAAVSDVNVGGIVELVDLDALNVDAEISEDRLASVHEGTPALIFLDAYPGKVYDGTAGHGAPYHRPLEGHRGREGAFDLPPLGVFPNMGAKCRS